MMKESCKEPRNLITQEVHLAKPNQNWHPQMLPPLDDYLHV